MTTPRPEQRQPECSDCLEFDRRGFLGTLGVGAAVVGGLAPVSAFAAETAPAASTGAKPAEGLIRELYETLTSEQKQTLVYPWDHNANGDMPTRLMMVNRPHFGKKIGESYTKPQQELCQRILRAICSGDDGYEKISRGGTFDGSGSFEGLGAVIFGEPSDGKKYSFVISGHHLTLRCDGNSEPGAAFGGPMYYGHSPHGYSPKNAYFYQTKRVMDVFGALDEGHRKQAIVAGSNPGEQAKSVQFRPEGETRPGVSYAALSADQRKLVEDVMRDVLGPYRKEDADEVMSIVKANGGLEKMNLAFYEDPKMDDNHRWHFWRLEGPGFVWNYRILPHVHTFVHIANKV